MNTPIICPYLLGRGSIQDRYHQLIMNVIFHRNCLDGSFSSFIAYLAARLTNEYQLSKFIEQVKMAIVQMGNDITTYQPAMHQQKQYTQMIEINEQFFHTPRGVFFNAYSFFAGQYYLLKFPGNSKILLIVDTNLSNAENIQSICSTHELVIMIDHHTSFKDIKIPLHQIQIKNLAYVFDQSRCAAQLTFDFLSKMLQFDRHLSEQFKQRLRIELKYVSANDTKVNQTKESKAFVLGFYYFQIQLSHNNPNLYKRIGMIDLQYLLQRGQNLYTYHLAEIREEIAHAKVVQFTFNSQRFKGKKCLYLQPRNANKISDIGNVLAFISAKHGMQNLAVLAMKKQVENRISCRSHRQCKDPSALELAKLFEGGGHREAAGFKIGNGKFKSGFKVTSVSKNQIGIVLEKAQIQQILFQS